MELKRAIEVLTIYNQWRLGADIEIMQPSTITLALNKVIEEYTKTGNGTQSAMKAYDTVDNKVAANIAVENLGKPYIAQEIEKRLQDAKDMIYTLAMWAEKDEVKLRASQDIVDRIEGKALQKIEQKTDIWFDIENAGVNELLKIIKQK